MPTSKVIVKKSNAKELLKRLEKKAVYIGLTKDSDPYDDGTSVVQVGIDHEYGSDKPRTYESPRGNSVTVSGIPERSFMRSTFGEKNKNWSKRFAIQVGLIIKGTRNSSEALNTVAGIARDDIKNKIVAINEPANSPQVIADKGSSNPLIDTGHMLNAITYDVREA